LSTSLSSQRTSSHLCGGAVPGLLAVFGAGAFIGVTTAGRIGDGQLRRGLILTLCALPARWTVLAAASTHTAPSWSATGRPAAARRARTMATWGRPAALSGWEERMAAHRRRERDGVPVELQRLLGELRQCKDRGRIEVPLRDHGETSPPSSAAPASRTPQSTATRPDRHTLPAPHPRSRPAHDAHGAARAR
jgi:hypothetical protein